jgi:hypothetical protein
MSVKMRQLVEKEISVAVVNAILTAGFKIAVDNGDGKTKPSEFGVAVLRAMFLADDDRLYIYKNDETDWFGWAHLVYGNDGWDVLSDYTGNLEQYIGRGTETDKIIQKYAD